MTKDIEFILNELKEIKKRLNDLEYKSQNSRFSR